MKNLLISLLFMLSGSKAFSQIPAAGNVLWLRADIGVFNNAAGTQAVLGDLVQVWEDQSGNANHFYQAVNSYRPQLVAISNTLCSQPLILFDINRRTYLGSSLKLSGAKTIFIVFLQPGLAGNPETLLSIKGLSDTYTEILCTDHPAYRPISYICELPSSTSGGTTLPAVGNTISFSPAGNIFTMTYDGGAVSSTTSYSANYNTSPAAVASSGLFGRLVNDTTTIGGRAPEQNYSFLSGYIAEIIVYNRVVPAAEISQVEFYLSQKYGFAGSCSVLPANTLNLTAQLRNSAVQLNWQANDNAPAKEYIVEHSIDNRTWDSTGYRPVQAPSGNEKDYGFIHSNPFHGINYYRIRINYQDGKIRYSTVSKIKFSKTGRAAFSITPNPSRDHVYVQAEKNQTLKLTFLNTNGQVVRELNTFSNTAVNISTLPPGIYFLKINGKNGKTVEKFLKP